MPHHAFTPAAIHRQEKARRRRRLAAERAVRARRLSFTLEVTGPADSLGRAPFTLTWFDDRERGQCFFADPEEHRAALQQRGHEVFLNRRTA